MKFRHGTFVSGTLVGAHSGHVHSIAITGLASPPDLDGSLVTPLRYMAAGGPGGDWSQLYAHGGLVLVAASGNRESVAYSSWTEAAGTYTFAVDATLRYSYTGGEVAGPVNVACLRSAAGAKLVSVFDYPLNVRLADYTDGDVNLSGCSGLTPSGDPAWDGRFDRDVYHSEPLTWLHIPAISGVRSISGKHLSNAYLWKWKDYYPVGYWSDNTQWYLVLQVGPGFMAPYVWIGARACGSGSPAGTYTKFSGCAAGPSALEVELDV